MVKSKLSRVILLTFFILLSVNSLLLAQRRAAAPVPVDTVLVEIRDTNITKRDLRDRISNLPSQHQHRYRTIEGQQQILEMVITEQVFHKKALELGVDRREEVINAINVGLRPVANQIFFEESLAREVPALDARAAEIHYQENIADFTVLPRITIRHLQVDRENLPMVSEAISQSVDFLQLVETYSTNEISSQNRGFIRNIRINGFITGIGTDTELENHIATAAVDPNIVHGPFETTTGIHFFKKLDFEPAVVRPFAEVQFEIAERLSMEREMTFYRGLIGRLRDRYSVVVSSDILDQVNVSNIAPELREISIVTGTHPEIVITLGGFSHILRHEAMTERLDVNDRNVRDRILNREIESRLLSIAALEANTLEIHRNRFEVQQVKLAAILNSFYRTEILGRVEVTDEELLEFYEANTHRYTIPAARNIRQFIAADERAARRYHRSIQRMLRRGREDNIIALVRQESLNSTGDGVLSNVYRNRIIPGIGVDDVYNEKVFTTEIGVLSSIFRNRNNEVVFFYVMNEVPERVRPLAEVENSMINIITRQKANELFEQTLDILIAEYNVITHFDRIVTMITPEELFTLAEEAQRRMSYTEAISFFDLVLTNFTGTEHAYRAMFMKAFVTSEEIRNRDRAIELFEEFLEKFPEGDLNESAEFMLEALKSDTPIELMFGE